MQQFLDAMKAIRGEQTQACVYQVPTAATGTLDPTKVNVRYTPGSGAAVVLSKMSAQSACDATTGGWYYDNSTSPTEIVLCPASCAVVQADTNARVELLLGCASQG